MSATMDVNLDPNRTGSLFEAITGDCCHIETIRLVSAGSTQRPCKALAEYEIENTLTRDPYSKFTNACEVHVGEMLGWEVEIPPNDLVRAEWKIRPVEVECKACATKLLWIPELLRAHAEMVQKRDDGELVSCGEFWRVAQEGKEPAGDEAEAHG